MKWRKKVMLLEGTWIKRLPINQASVVSFYQLMFLTLFLRIILGSFGVMEYLGRIFRKSKPLKRRNLIFREPSRDSLCLWVTYFSHY